MYYVWQSLIWKEWHEHKWKLASLLAILLSVQLLSIWRDPSVPPFFPLGAVLWIYGIPAAVFLAMGTAAGERANGTLEFMRSLPIAPGKVLATKLLVGAGAILLPIIPLALVAMTWTIVRTQSSEPGVDFVAALFGTETLIEGFRYFFMFAAAVCMVFLWATAAGAGQPTELRAGLAGVAVVVAWFAVLTMTQWAPSPTTWGTGAAHPLQFIWWCAPLGLMLDAEMPGAPTLSVVACQLLMAVCLILWTRYRFARLTGADDRSPAGMTGEAISLTGPIARPYRSRLGALVWKHRQELLPSFLVGAVLFVGFVFIDLDSLHLEEPDWPYLVLRLRGALGVIGMLLALVIGVGTFAGELQPGISAFWRSRPIQPSAWFWTKFLTGAAALLFILEGPVVAMYALPGVTNLAVEDGYLICLPLSHLLIYTAAVCLACLLRQAVYAGILAFGFLFVSEAAAWFDPRLAWLSPVPVMTEIHLNGSSDLLLPFVIATMGITIFFALVAWQAVRLDIGVKR